MKVLTGAAMAAALLLPTPASAFTISLPFFRITIGAPHYARPHYSRPRVHTAAKRPPSRQTTTVATQRPQEPTTME